MVSLLNESKKGSAHFCMAGYARHTMCAPVIRFINTEVGRLSIRLKIKKEKNIKIKTTNANRKQQQQKIKIIAKLGFEPRSLAWKAKIIATGVLYHMSN